MFLVDAKDVKVDGRAIQDRLENLGMVFGATYKLDVENNYMGFKRERWLDFLTDLILDSEPIFKSGEATWKPLFDLLD